MKDLTAYLVPNLDLKAGDKTYSVPPPSQRNGLILAAIVTSGANIVDGDTIPEHTQKLLDSIPADQPIGELSLGKDVYAQMVADEVPEAHIDQLSSYAMYYWALGEATADAVFEAQYGMSDVDAPKDSTAPLTGLSTESGSRTKTASTPDTATRPQTSDRKRPAKTKAAASPGKASSKPGL